jgi:ArsR family transcriptional regulator, lead/cadmium/zinc/bismuth-responsive transcriptional repressor
VPAVDRCDLLCLDLETAEAVRAALDRERTAMLAAVAKVVSDPTRLLVMQALAQRELCGCDLGWVTDQSEKVVSHHLGRLRREGLITSRREGKTVFASLTDRGREFVAMIEAVAA